jgi:hypothetical protein
MLLFVKDLAAIPVAQSDAASHHEPAIKNSFPRFADHSPFSAHNKERSSDKPPSKALKTEETHHPPPEYMPQVRFSSHLVENKHVT